MLSEHKKIYLSPPHMSGKEQHHISEAFASNWIAPLGPHIDAFEQEIAEYAGVNGAVAVSSGTAALHLSLCLLNVKQGDYVFCSSFTFIASANPILYLGAEPVFIDSEPETWNMSPQALQRALEDAYREGIMPKAVIVVHLYGQSSKMQEILTLCDNYNVPVIEDSAESLGSTYNGKKSGSLGKFGVYSFNGNKIITTSGGGMLISDDEDALRRARFLATQARDNAPHYQHSTMGYNYRMSNLLAGVGRAQLEVLDERVTARRKIFDIYKQSLAHLDGIQFMPELNNTKSNRWLSAMTIDFKKTGVSVQSLLAALMDENIEARNAWKPLHLQPLFKGKTYYSHEEQKNVSEEVFKSGICLPSGSSMTEEEQERVVNCIQAVLEKAYENKVENSFVS